jgi:hypothetical protein
MAKYVMDVKEFRSVIEAPHLPKKEKVLLKYYDVLDICRQLS